MFTASKKLFFTLILGILLLTACNLPQNAPATQNSPELIYTAAAATVSAQLTQAAQGTLPTPAPATATPNVVVFEPTATQQVVVAPTSTQAPPPTAAPTSTQPAPTAVVVPCDRASFVKDITYPDGTEVPAGTTFVKTWRLKNNGTCTWNSSYSLVFVNGDSMDGPAVVQLTTGTVAPGQEMDISVTLTAPSTPKEYTGNWKLRNGNNTVFGVGDNAQAAFWVKVKVVSPATPTPSANMVYNFLEKAPSAEWRNATTLLPWGDPANDSNGVATYLDNAKLNDGKTYTRVLATYPHTVDDGIITGLFSPYIVQDKDHFTAKIGFKSSCDNGQVKFQLNYVENGLTIAIKEWSKTCDSTLTSIDVDLSSLKGKTVNFMLAVVADGKMDHDWAVWVDPRIVR